MDLRGDGEGREVIVIFLTMGKASNQRQSWAGLAKKTCPPSIHPLGAPDHPSFKKR